jgi:hypothetical protein
MVDPILHALKINVYSFGIVLIWGPLTQEKSHTLICVLLKLLVISKALSIV